MKHQILSEVFPKINNFKVIKTLKLVGNGLRSPINNISSSSEENYLFATFFKKIFSAEHRNKWSENVLKTNQKLSITLTHCLDLAPNLEAKYHFHCAYNYSLPVQQD
jgi:hypothetical protein